MHIVACNFINLQWISERNRKTRGRRPVAVTVQVGRGLAVRPVTGDRRPASDAYANPHLHVLCIGKIIIVLSGPLIDIIDKLLDDSPLVNVGLSEKSMPFAPVRLEPVDHNFTNRVAARRYWDILWLISIFINSCHFIVLFNLVGKIFICCGR